MKVRILTDDEARPLANQNQISGKAFPVVHADAPALGGKYMLFSVQQNQPEPFRIVRAATYAKPRPAANNPPATHGCSALLV